MRSGRGVGAGAGGVSPRRPAPREEESWRSGAASSRPDAAGGPCGRLRNPRWTSVLRRRAGTGWRRLLNRPWPWRRQAQAPGPARDGPPARGVRGRGALRAAGERHGLQEGAAQGAGPGPGPQPGGPALRGRGALRAPPRTPPPPPRAPRRGTHPRTRSRWEAPAPAGGCSEPTTSGGDPGASPPPAAPPGPGPPPGACPAFPPDDPFMARKNTKNAKKQLLTTRGAGITDEQ